MMSGKHYPMKSDVRVKDNAYLLDIDLPGCRKEDIKAYLENGYLHVVTSFNKEKEKGHGKFLTRECYSGEYQRSFYVGSEVSEEGMKAQFKHGVLRIKIPQKAVEENNNTKSQIMIAG